MGNLLDLINSEIKSAMLSKNTLKRDCLRMVVSEIKNQTVNAGKPVTEEICTNVLRKSVKTHNDSIEQFEKAGRADLVEKEREELSIIESFLPKMLDENDTKIVVQSTINALGMEPVKKNFGKIMKEISNSPRSAQIDKKIVSKILNEILN